MFKVFERSLLELGPHPGFPFASEQVEDELPVKVYKSGEQPDSFDRGGGFPFLYGFQLLPVHLDFSLTNDHA